MTQYTALTIRSESYFALSRDSEKTFPSTSSYCKGMSDAFLVVRDEMTVEEAEREYR